MGSALPSPSSKIQKLVKGEDKGEDKDIISKLPDSALLYILSFLLTKDAVRTSILSTKWRYLWTGMSNFDFNDDLSYKKTRKKILSWGRVCLNWWIECSFMILHIYKNCVYHLICLSD